MTLRSSEVRWKLSREWTQPLRLQNSSDLQPLQQGEGGGGGLGGGARPAFVESQNTASEEKKTLTPLYVCSFKAAELY